MAAKKTKTIRVADWMTVRLIHFEHEGYEWPRVGLAHPTIAPYGAFPTRGGGEILIAVRNDEEFGRLASDVLDDATVARDARFRTNRDRVAHRVFMAQAVVHAELAIERGDVFPFGVT